ncbi:MAG: GH36 C-terminal domain-containing protein, partial [Actinomycetes bacterium]|nr:GH36 C-terminal domain-containing protein [Actinomycetes bacterium]MDX5380778.1 GH36 C-terminal domain-containing protein [Actinomycetes bacterium]MDX5399801.1 GH36 C-terminal domain-containing protein [Actinomycetes bacterium]MDX5450518.1 GH36 C-terminal domain-containing protein [Actinomycetes bacterium]
LGNPVLQLDGVVAADRREALYRLSALDLTLTWPPGRVPLPGLDPDVVYHVTAQAPGDAVTHGPWAPPWGADGVRLTGRALAEVGIQSPLLGVDQLVLLRARAD